MRINAVEIPRFSFTIFIVGFKLEFGLQKLVGSFFFFFSFDSIGNEKVVRRGRNSDESS